MLIAWILFGLVALFILWAVATYNRLIRLQTQSQEAWADIDVQLKRRYDLIPNLVNTVKGYATHESKLFEEVAHARSAAMSATAPQQKAAAENALTGMLHGLLAVVEAYPELKANENFLKLQDELSDTENKIQAARRFYNGNVRDLNTSLLTFPTNVLASFFSFQAKEFFELQNEQERQTPEVKF